ncbi:hypothetical protein LAUMK35_01382 [Mycobacterium pseudokansasii]|uniref:Glutamate synthase domain-containing protein n=1 Tax=Mycobacterium pseudokansasii TaxID=2341080 RepID=A0A498QJV4_9MYCO|nr:hypothetical protein LAUMK35_01382 [Mycobacterium pseudokansasii]VAZ91710.1 hypothetical protein LAUMK21_01382 [Mycobacterium pseudokansasii]VBA48279.1 hypothetical protein LAUMK142_01236 [Mycobacterium pseudokansasii]
MSFGSLGGAAITALNKGAAIAGALQTTGEGGISPYHLNGGDLVWQIGTGYFGCRNDDGTFSLPRLIDPVAATPSIRASKSSSVRAPSRVWAAGSPAAR